MSADPTRPATPQAAPPPSVPRLLTGLSTLAQEHDGFILDLWGVIHDGVKAFPDAVECLRRLRAMDKRIVLLSNAPRRVEPIARSMAEMGIDRGLYDHILSSGEEVYQALRSRRDPWYAALGRACLHLGPERDRNMCEGLDLEVVETVEAADFVLNTGPWRDDETVADYEDVLAAAARRALPMICANPDLEVIRGGHRVICAGALAARYEELGGDVRYHGKPYPSIYRHCCEMLGIADRRRILAVGDSLRTDIAGAAAAGIDSVLVTGGIHAEELGPISGATRDPVELARACATVGPVPTAAIPAFIW